MNAVRGLLRDLVQRRLWPVAVLLVAGAVALPVYLGRSSSDGADAPLGSTGEHAAAGKASRAAVRVDDTTTADDRPGAVRNPFKQRHVAKQDTTPDGNSTPAKSSDSTPNAGGAGGSTTPTTGTTDVSTPTPTPSTGSGTSGSGTTTPSVPKAIDALDSYHLTVRFGRTDQPLKTIKDIARLSPLPNSISPFMVYTGVLKDGKTAVLLLSSDATGTGDGHCKPTPKDCETVEVQQGNTEFFDLTVDGQPVQYQLDVVRLVKTQGTSVQASEAAVRRHSQAGAALLRTAHLLGNKRFAGASAYRWVPDQGVLVRAPRKTKAHASTDGAAPSAGPVVLPGQPVWHWKLGS